MPEGIRIYRPNRRPPTDSRRKKHARFYGSARWKKVRKQVLDTEPLCRMCSAEGLTVPAVDVDHIRPLDEAPHLATDRSNLQPLCKPHHAGKTRLGK